MMKFSWPKYWILGAVFIGSLILTWAFRGNGSWDPLLATPGVLSLLGAIFQLVRDEASHLRSLAVQHDQQRFQVAITSHMADVAFDRHVALCEDFVQQLFKTLQGLMSSPQDHEAARRHADNLGDIIRKHAVWVSPELQTELEAFEQSVRMIAAKGYVAARMGGADSYQETLNLLLDLMDPGSAPSTPPKRQLSYVGLIEHARSVLGVKELTEMRKAIFSRGT